jgi:hypothetical protein
MRALVSQERFTMSNTLLSSPNQRIKLAPFGRPIRKSEALLLSAYAQR